MLTLHIRIHLSQELPPAFPANKGMFLVTTDRSRGRLPLFVDTEMLLNGPQGGNNSAGPGGRFYRHSASPPDRIGGGHILNRFGYTPFTWSFLDWVATPTMNKC